jgi:hypothetical protein
MLTLPYSIFCQIIEGNIPSMKVAETPLSYAFLDLHPVAPKHSLVVSKQHGAKLHDLDDEHLADLLPLVKKVAQATGAVEYNVMQNNGRGAYQTVDHVHCESMIEEIWGTVYTVADHLSIVHVIPKPDTSQGLILSKESWPVTNLSQEELKKVCVPAFDAAISLTGMTSTSSQSLDEMLELIKGKL